MFANPNALAAWPVAQMTKSFLLGMIQLLVCLKVKKMQHFEADWVLVIGAEDTQRVKDGLRISEACQCYVKGTLTEALQTLRTQQSLPSSLYILANEHGGLNEAMETYTKFCRSAAAGRSLIVSMMPSEGGTPTRPMIIFSISTSASGKIVKTSFSVTSCSLASNQPRAGTQIRGERTA